MVDSIPRDLRRQLAEDIHLPVLISLGLAGIILVGADLEAAPPPSISFLGILLLVLAVSIWVLKRDHPTLAAWALVFGLCGISWLAWQWFPESGAEFTFIFMVVIAAFVLGTGACVGAASLTTAALLIGAGWPKAGPIGASTITALALVWGVAGLALITQWREKAILYLGGGELRPSATTLGSRS